jgi:hypothetical protein
MKASIVDLRYRMRDVLKALERNEEVEILYHGKVKGIIKPAGAAAPAPADAAQPAPKVEAHPFFGMDVDGGAGGNVDARMDALRGGRHRAV